MSTNTTCRQSCVYMQKKLMMGMMRKMESDFYVYENKVSV